MCYLMMAIVDGVSFIPNRTPIRDRIFLGIKESAPVPISTGAIVALPPAAAIQGVNATALANSDLHEYGSMGVPAEVVEARQAAGVAPASGPQPGATPIPKSFLAQQSKETVRHALDFFSVLWLIVILVACVVFLGAALREANKRRAIKGGGVGATPTPASHSSIKKNNGIRSRPVSVADKRIDREAYVYVDGG